MEFFMLESPHHPITNAKFRPITEPLPKSFPEPFPKPFPDLMEISMLEAYYLAPHRPIPNAKFPPITTFLNRSTYHKSAKDFPPPSPQILWAPQINE